MRARFLASLAFLFVVLGALAFGGLASAESASAAEGIETYVACGLTRSATPSHVCHLAEEKEFGAFFRSPTEVTYTACVEFPTAKTLCADAQVAAAETLYVNKITSNLPGTYRVTWSGGGEQVGSWEFEVPVDPPAFGKTVTVVPGWGSVRVKGPGESSYSPLTATGSVRSGSVLDTTHGSVN